MNLERRVLSLLGKDELLEKNSRKQDAKLVLPFHGAAKAE